MSFKGEVDDRVRSNGENASLQEGARNFLTATIAAQYSYNFEWLGRPIIQYPQDMVAVQELVWDVKPDLIIETGIAHGGSLILSASLLALLDYCDAIENGTTLDPKVPKRRVLGVDIDIREHNHAAILAHPMSNRIDMIQGSAIAPEITDQVREAAAGFKRVMVFLDSNHTHAHVLEELEAYAPLVTPGSYCCVFDTVVEDLPGETYDNRPWGVGNNPKTAVFEYLGRISEEGRTAADGAPLKLEIDRTIQDKILITVAPEGYLRRI
jgi:cephalosporin hydroxylase